MHLKTNLLKATEETCGISKQVKWQKQIWRWDNSVNYGVNEKEDFLRSGKEDYTLAKIVAKQTDLQQRKKLR